MLLVSLNVRKTGGSAGWTTYGTFLVVVLGLWRLSIRHFNRAKTALLNKKERLYEIDSNSTTNRHCPHLPVRFKRHSGPDAASKIRRPGRRTARRQGLHRRRCFGRDGQGGVELDRADES